MSKKFERIIVVMLENSSRENTLSNTYMSELCSKGVFLTNYNGVTHPSQPNYIASIAGDTVGINNDLDGYASTPFFRPNVPCLVDRLNESSSTWRCYVEDLPTGFVEASHENLVAHREKFLNPLYKEPDAAPGEGPTEEEMKAEAEGNKKLFVKVRKSLHDTIPAVDEAKYPHFARRHVPFLSFQNVVLSDDVATKVVHADELETDLSSPAGLPNVCWYVPNLINDGHSLTDEQKANYDTEMRPRNYLNSTNVENFLKAFLTDDPIKKFGDGTLIALVYDEAVPYTGPYGVYALLMGSMLEAEKGTEQSGAYNHYSLLRTIEENFDLELLGRNDLAAQPFWLMNS